MVAYLEEARNIILLAIGFGFVVFWHELGHFLAAKWAGVKVEQFAVGFGQAVFSWRKGIGIRYGNTQKEFKQRIEKHLNLHEEQKQKEELQLKEKVDGMDGPTDLQVARAAAELGLGETEYRLNWIPLGGYVKMLGQDDLKPNAEADDPRAFNRQPIGKRMVIVSAGVIMNVILAAIGFMVLFLMGFNVQPAIVGSVIPGAPAQTAKFLSGPPGTKDGLLPGDLILTINGKDQHNEYTKVQLSAALCPSDEATPVEVQRVVDGKPQKLKFEIEPKRGGLSKDFLMFGIAPAQELKAPTLKELKAAGADINDKSQEQMLSPDLLAMKPGEAIVAIGGQPVDPGAPLAFVALDNALQAGKPVDVTVAADEGKGARRPITVQPHFMDPFSEDPLNFAGMVPRVRIAQVMKESDAFGKLLPGDIVTKLSTGSNSGGVSPTVDDPSIKVFRQKLNEAGNVGADISITVLRGDKILPFNNLHAKKIDPRTYGMKIAPEYDESHSLVADVLAGSAAERAKIPARAAIVTVGGDPISSWFDVQSAMKKYADGLKDGATTPLPVAYKTEGGQQVTANLELNGDELAAIRSYRYRQDLDLGYEKVQRKTNNPAVAASWGVEETRDFILQFYVTLNRMRSGDVSPKNLMGPLGILEAGTGFAAKGNDWLIWFLSMISANLAVVNFLPIPIVDGGLFTFLIIEKLKGRPLSPKTQAIAQYVGMALLLGIVLFVTWQDIINFQFRMH